MKNNLTPYQRRSLARASVKRRLTLTRKMVDRKRKQKAESLLTTLLTNQAAIMELLLAENKVE